MAARHTIRHAYGNEAEQFGELTVPPGPSLAVPVVVLLHGGFWRAHRTLDLMRPLVDHLVADGFAVWNLEYRRVGQPGGGWPGTMVDVATGVDALHTLPGPSRLDLDPVIIVGHSAGGQLALWVASDRPLPSGDRTPASPAGTRSPSVRPWAVVSLAGLCDLHAAAADGLGRDATPAFLGGTPAQVPARYACASPAALLPLGLPQVLVHGDADVKVPPTQSRVYARQARAAGDDVALIEVPGADHIAVIEPAYVLSAVSRAMPH